MSVTLSSADVGQLETAQMLLLSPLDHESLTHWRVAVRGCLTTLLGADHAASLIPVTGEPLIESSSDLARAYEAYLAYYHTLDTGLEVRRRALGLEVCHWSQLYDMATLPTTEIYNDWSRPNGLLDAICVCSDFDPALPPAGFWFYHARENSQPFGERGLLFLRLLSPAFKASVHVIRQLLEHRASLTQLLDELSEGILVVSATGRVLHETPALLQSLAEDPERERVRCELLHTARGVAALAHRVERPPLHAPALGMPAWHEVRTVRARYRIHANYSRGRWAGPDAVAFVTLERVSPLPLSDEQLKVRFSLTKREIETARFVERGKSLSAIARELGVSAHTVRHHAEHLRMKFGVERLAEVAAKMRD